MEWVFEALGLPYLCLASASAEAKGGGPPQLNSHARSMYAAAAGPAVTEAMDPALVLARLLDCNPERAEAFQKQLRDQGHLSASTTHGRVVAMLETQDGSFKEHWWFLLDSIRFTSGIQLPAAKADASASLAHELANALGAVVGWTDLALQRRQDPELLDQALTRIRAGTRSAHATARFILDSSRGQAVDGPEHIELTAFVEDLVDLMQPLFDHKGVEVIVQRDRSTSGQSADGESARVQARKPQLSTVIWNLVQNALEATPTGGSVTVRTSEGPNHTAQVSVTDGGPGVAQDLREQIFAPYFTTKDKGTGLGLALVRKTARALDGDVALLPSKSGAHFQFTLPTVDGVATTKPDPSVTAPANRGNNRPQATSLQPLAGLRLIVVDDDPSMRELLATTLELRGAHVFLSTGLADLPSPGGAPFDVAPYDVALVDLTLAEDRGDEVIAALRAKQAVNHAILVTGSASFEGFVEGGAPDRWIRKPFDLDELVAEVADICARELPKTAPNPAATG